MDRSASPRIFGSCAVASAWLLALTALNLADGGHLRGTVLYAVPVAITAWQSWRLGFLFAAVGMLSALAGGAIPQPQAVEPLWAEGMWAFSKLSAVALIMHYGARSSFGKHSR
jgi:hypothetical protein